ncbi:MAG TPA: DUF721 domain-containing protein [Catalimonadaceae bacterium]|jgi:predicted nucleic acid-binding Zn ribbon protein|nr:DUF721 domain-containing protein [Catalimonadaceae bacterium]
MSEAIQSWIKAHHLEDKMLQASIADTWSEIMGKAVSRHTRSIRMENKILKIVVDNAPLRHQLSHSKSRIIQLINEKAGRQVVLECLIL